MNRYGPKAQQEIRRALFEFSEGRLRSGPSRQLVTSRKQAIAIGISRARLKRYKTPHQASKNTTP